MVTVRVSDGVNTNSRSFTVTLRPVNDLPAISRLNAIEINEDTTASVPILLSDLETPAAGLVLQVQSSNLEVLDESGIVIEGTGGNRILRLTPLSEAAGNTEISVTVTDGDSGSATTTFALDVIRVNDAPTITGPSVVTINEDSTNNVVSFVVADADSLAAGLLVSVSSTNPVLLPPANLVLGGTDGNRALSITPAPNEFGTTTVNVVVRESLEAGALSATNLLTVVVVPLNDPPTLDAVQPVPVAAGSPAQTISLSGIGMGASNEGQTLTVTARSGDVAVIPHPAITYTSPAAAGTLTFAPNAGATGSVTITVLVTESGGVLAGGTNQISRTFLVTVGASGPALLVQQLAGRAVVSWPSNGPAVWRLESTTNVALGTSWLVSPAVPVIVNGRFTVTNQIDGATRFYRLRNQ